MSGDVQPRKRKDKKRRKDEGAEQIPTQTHAPISTSSSNDDVNIHVHKEGGTGGGICAKLVFFALLSALVVVLGMIITQYRGLSDVDTVDTESRFAQIFEGWIDVGHRHERDVKEDHHLDPEDQEDADNVSEAEDDEDHGASEEEEDGEGNEDNAISEENEDEEQQDDDDDDEEEEQPTEESDEDQPADVSDENALSDEDGGDSEAEASNEEKKRYEEVDSEEKDEEADEDEDNDEDEEEHDEDEQELQNIESDEKDDDEYDGDEVSVERRSSEKEDEDDGADEDTPAEDGAVESDENVAATAKKIEVKEDVDGHDTATGEKQQESSGMAVKLGVGVALLVVAHLVLVRKWRSAPDVKPPKEEPAEPVPDLTRRNTIVAPPTLQEVEPDIEQDEEDYSEEELSDEEEHVEPKSAKTRYQELRSTYARSLTPEGEIDYHKDPGSYEEEYEDEEGASSDEEDEEDEEESENDDYDEDEDEELLKRLEAKYGKLHGDKNEGASGEQHAEDSDSDRQSDDDAAYEYSNITNKEDYKVKDEIDEAQKAVRNNSAYAIKNFDKILQKYPSSPRSIYGKALSLDYLADQRRSNEILQQALNYYTQLLNTANVPDALFEMAAERCINRMRFVGQYRNAINVHKKLTKRFPDNPKYANDLAVTYLTINRVEEARSVLKEVLLKWPDDGFALVHYGFILKTTDNKLKEAVIYLKQGLATKAEGVIDGRFYFHLGDALTRLGQNKEAIELYEEGVKNKVFLSKYQRSLYNVPRLTAKPWWEIIELPYLDLYRLLTQNWQKIKEEGLAILNEKGYFQDEAENLRDTGEWKQFELFARGQKNVNNCKKCPFTCSIIDRIAEAKNCRRGQTKFSVMHPGTHVWPHCGPTNCRLRAHLGLKVPPDTFIRVAEEIRSWKEGEVFVFDDSFEHEVWHNGTDFRLVLIVDVWHPELTATEKRNLSPI